MVATNVATKQPATATIRLTRRARRNPRGCTREAFREQRSYHQEAREYRRGNPTDSGQWHRAEGQGCETNSLRVGVRAPRRIPSRHTMHERADDGAHDIGFPEHQEVIAR